MLLNMKFWNVAKFIPSHSTSLSHYTLLTCKPQCLILIYKWHISRYINNMPIYIYMYWNNSFLWLLTQTFISVSNPLQLEIVIFLLQKCTSHYHIISDRKFNYSALSNIEKTLGFNSLQIFGLSLRFSWKALRVKSVALFMKSTWKATKTTDSTQISHFDLVFHRVQREGQLGRSYILMVFGGAHVCLVVHVCVYGACMHTCLVFCIIWFHHGFHKM